MLMEVTKEFTFDAAHHLPDYNGRCRNVHGHTWTLRVSMKGVIDPSTGMVCDFARIKEKIEESIIKTGLCLDHRDLNELIDNPTCENLIYRLAVQLHRIAFPWSKLELSETPTSWCTLLREDFDEKA
jgi:6-pyruvoyltetrahydropterin/6-carboxytetrahydropterin synthase